AVAGCDVAAAERAGVAARLTAAAPGAAVGAAAADAGVGAEVASGGAAMAWVVSTGAGVAVARGTRIVGAGGGARGEPGWPPAQGHSLARAAPTTRINPTSGSNSHPRRPRIRGDATTCGLRRRGGW